MNTRTIATLGASALVLAAAAAGIASASDRDDAKAAAAGAASAGKALARHDGRGAVAAAEKAVSLAPHQAEYRMLLGRSYLAAGRFASARGAFADALTLAPTNGKAALDLVLAQIATGDWAAARRSLEEHGAGIAAADRGLALALAGDPNGAVQLLTQVARSPDTNAKVRQNLALSFALAGQWPAARAAAAVDVSPADLDARLEQWAAFARPHAAADQVATLLGVTPVEDPGQPAQLALATDPLTVVAAASVPLLPITPTPVVEARPAPSPAVAVVEPHPQPGFAVAQVTFGPRAEVVQPLHAVTASDPAKPRILRADGRPIKVALGGTRVAAPAPAVVRNAGAPAAKGSWFVQFGAFQSSAGARDAWGRIAHRVPAVAGRTPSGVNFTVNKTTYYRLSVGGFSRGDADVTCRRFKAAGGECFVRAGAGDQLASWLHKGVQVASR